MAMKRISSTFFFIVLFSLVVPGCFGQYTTEWVANTFGTNDRLLRGLLLRHSPVPILPTI